MSRPIPRAQFRLTMLLCIAAVVAIFAQGVNFEIARRTRAREALEAEDLLQRARAKLGGVALLSADEIAALEHDPRLPALRRAAKNIVSLHEKKRPLGANDWLAKYQESGQTFDQYLRSNPNRSSGRLTRFYLQPIGEFTVAQRRAVEETAELLSRFYSLPVELHCTAYECCMNGSNGLEELDSNPMWLCPECVQKVWWACSADPAQRYQRLADFAGKNHLVEEAAFWARSRDCLGE